MRIAVKQSPRQRRNSFVDYYWSPLVKAMAESLPNEEFSYLIDGKGGIGPAITNSLTSRWWYDVKLPSVLKNIQADLLLSDGENLSLRTEVPQILFVHHLHFLQHPANLSLREKWFYKTRFATNLQKSAAIITPSQCLKEQLVNTQKIASEKIVVIAPAPHPSFVPVHAWAQRESYKTNYSGAYEYFLFYGKLFKHRNIGSLLKAFSIFKKWQQSNMKLLLVGDFPHNNYDEVLDKLSSYKFKDDVILMRQPTAEKLAQIVGAAYTLILPSIEEEDTTPILNAMACEVPVIASDIPVIRECAEEAVLYVDPQNVQSIADQMMALYKNEDLLSEMIAKGKRHIERFSWENSGKQLKEIANSLI